MQDKDDVEVAGCAVNEEVMKERRIGIYGQDARYVRVRGTYDEAVSRGGKQPTTTKWVDGWKARR